MPRLLLPAVLLTLLISAPAKSSAQDASAAPAANPTAEGDRLVSEYFALRTQEIASRTESLLRSVKDWATESVEYRRQLHEMLGLDPLPERTPLNPVVMKTLIRGDFVVENIQFQSSPGLYVTGNLYRPKEVTEPLPTILYVCGHAAVKIDGVSYGNKAHYHHHGVWFARHGYVCLVIDSVQLGEIAGVHHGTYNLGQWWWLSRGYTPAGVEAWNCIRALDYLETRPEVDAKKFGVTGRSGGGAYSWWVSALDPRIQCSVPVAGITDLDDHVVRGCVEGHCDCMFMVNTYRWDYPMVAALVAPRPLLISNTDKDRIFPLEGVVHTYIGARNAYRNAKADAAFGLQITEGGHVDTQELRIHAMVWFDRYLKKTERPITIPAAEVLSPQDLKVFQVLPEDQLNSKVQELFVRTAETPVLPTDQDAWTKLTQSWKRALLDKTFRAWPQDQEVEPLAVQEAKTKSGSTLLQFTSQKPYELAIQSSQPAPQSAASRLEVVGTDDEWQAPLSSGTSDIASFRFAPRGIGPTRWSLDDRKLVQIRRRFYLLGETDDGMRVWDVRRAIRVVREQSKSSASVEIVAKGDAAVWALYASLFEDAPVKLTLTDLPISHMDGPQLLNVLKTLDIPQAVALAADRHQVELIRPELPADARWTFPALVSEKYGMGSLSVTK
jgi:dienelactone hydrolase